MPTTEPSCRPLRENPHPKYPPDATEGIQFTPAGTQRPRLLFSADELEVLKESIKDGREHEFFIFLKKRADAALERLAASKNQSEGPSISRGAAHGVAECALMYRLTQESKYLESSKAQLIRMSKMDGRKGDPFSGGHMLTEIAWAWDLIQEHFDASERKAILDFVTDFGVAAISTMLTPLDYSNATPMHNITICAWSGLGVAGLCFHDEIPKARVWAEAAQRMFRAMAWLQPPDGSGIEGPQYSVYSLERKTFYYEAARRCLGEDLYGPGIGSSPLWVKHLTKPKMVPKNNAFPWSDNGPYFDAHGPAFSIFAIARRFQDAHAQRIALELWDKGVGHSSGPAWTNLVFYDPQLKPADWTNDSTAHHFSDKDMVCTRASWTEEATAVSFSCGPYPGHRASRIFAGDPGGSHHHADTASFQIVSRGEDLLTDPGYEYIKHTDHHNTILVNGLGQLGEGLKWFNVNRVCHWNGTAEILSYQDNEKATAWVSEAHKMYLPEAKLIRFHRHMLYIRPDLVVVLDDLEAEEPSVFTQLWHGVTPFTRETPEQNWQLTNGKATLSMCAVTDSASGALTQQAEVITFPDLKNPKQREIPYSELRIETSKISQCNIATIIAIGSSSDSVPEIKASLSNAKLEIEGFPGGPLTVSFDLKNQQPPQKLKVEN